MTARRYTSTKVDDLYLPVRLSIYEQKSNRNRGELLVYFITAVHKSPTHYSRVFLLISITNFNIFTIPFSTTLYKM